MNSVAEDLKDFLVAQGVGVFKTDLFVDVLPDEPDLCVSLKDTGTWREPDVHNEYPLLQVLARGKPNGSRAAYAKIRAVYSTIKNAVPQTINSTWYGGFWVSSGITSVGQDERQRPLYSVNFRIMRSG